MFCVLPTVFFVTGNLPFLQCIIELIYGVIVVMHLNLLVYPFTSDRMNHISDIPQIKRFQDIHLDLYAKHSKHKVKNFFFNFVRIYCNLTLIWGTPISLSYNVEQVCMLQYVAPFESKFLVYPLAKDISFLQPCEGCN